MPRKKKPAKTSLENLSTEALHAELARREEQIAALEHEREELLAQVAEVDAQIEELGGQAKPKRGRPRKTPAAGTRAHGGGRRKKTAKKAASRTPSRGGRKRGPSKPTGSRKRHRNDTNLVEALRQVLKGTTMGVSEVAQAVQDAGYKTTSPNFRTIVNQTLIKHPDVFSKQARGLYTAR
ncbi:MAG: hypothetical protein RIB58_05390 [Phycisphaerales bacterium]